MLEDVKKIDVPSSTWHVSHFTPSSKVKEKEIEDGGKKWEGEGVEKGGEEGGGGCGGSGGGDGKEMLKMPLWVVFN
ncbi:hypothetical protein M0802_004333 [Mischocyttarus mexicanus]|nr:hypothetical protein M0802_004333 [Mischocyttarus mexicanus]